MADEELLAAQTAAPLVSDPEEEAHSGTRGKLTPMHVDDIAQRLENDEADADW